MASCPRCAVELHVRQATPPGKSEAIEVDCCPRCAGLWIDGAELGRASAHLGALFGRRQELVLEAGASELGCPRCGAALAEVHVKGVAVDWCRTCFGVWLDGGEYQAMQQAASRQAPPSHVRCYACRQQVPLGDTYYTDLGLVCSRCHGDAELAMSERAEEYRAIEQERQRLARAAEWAASRERVKQLRQDVSRSTYGELQALRDALK